MSRIKNIIENDTKRNMLTFVKHVEDHIHSDSHRCCLVKCDCGTEKIIRIDRFLKGHIKSCGCQCKTYKAKKSNIWLDPNYSFWVLLERMIKRGKKNKKEISIDTKDLKEQWEKQQGLCIYTKIKLRLPRCFTDLTDYNIPSIDRIDPAKGYVKGNIQFTLKCINFMKYQLSHDEFIKMCKLITTNYTESIN